MKQLLLGELLKQEGMYNSVANADNRIEAWSDRAYFILMEFISRQTDVFMGEDVREYAGKRGLPEPPSKRAWGAVMARAKKEGLIVFSGYSQVSNPKAHRANASLWRVNNA